MHTYGTLRCIALPPGRRVWDVAVAKVYRSTVHTVQIRSRNTKHEQRFGRADRPDDPLRRAKTRDERVEEENKSIHGTPLLGQLCAVNVRCLACS